MSRSDCPTFDERSIWLKPIDSIGSIAERRNRILVAISDADLNGFPNTKDSLIEILKSIPTRHF